MKNLLILLMIGNLFGGYFSDNFLKYSTFYSSTSLESPYTPKQTFEVNTQEGTFEETTEEVGGSYNISFGMRKLARFKYQVKKKNFYDGSENELSDVATIGAVSGWEYLLKWSKVRSFGETFVDSESWIRYLGDWFVVKGSYANFGRDELEFAQIDARYRKAIGQSWNFTGGVLFRGHPAYGLFPFNKWLKQNQGQWWELAYNYGYTDEQYNVDDDLLDYNWYDENGTLVAESDDEFYEYYYGDLITLYNEEEVDKLGWQYEGSVVLGVDYYKYEKKWWIHGWLTTIPYSKGFTPYSFKHEQGNIDFDIGLVTGWKLNRQFGIFGEGRYISYWGIDSYELKAGLNYTFF